MFEHLSLLTKLAIGLGMVIWLPRVFERAGLLTAKQERKRAHA